MSANLIPFGSAIYTQYPLIMIHARKKLGNSGLLRDLYTFLIDNAKKQLNGIYITPMSQSAIGKELEVERETVNRNLRKLKEKGLIDIITNKGQISSYVILDITESELSKNTTKKNLIKKYDNIKAKPNATLNSEIEKIKKEKIQLTEEQQIIKQYIENKIQDKLTNKKMIILWNAALNNPEIKENLTENIKLIVDNVIEYSKNIKNNFGYIKKSIINYKAAENAPESPYSDIAEALKLKLENDYPVNYHLSSKQCIALCSIADKKIIKTKKTTLPISTFLISEVINKSRVTNGIKDLFRYMIQIINNFGSEQPNLKKKKYSYERKEQSYDINEFKSFSVTFSGNTKNISAYPKNISPDPIPDQQAPAPKIKDEISINPVSVEYSSIDIEKFRNDCAAILRDMRDL